MQEEVGSVSGVQKCEVHGARVCFLFLRQNNLVRLTGLSQSSSTPTLPPPGEWSGSPSEAGIREAGLQGFPPTQLVYISQINKLLID